MTDHTKADKLRGNRGHSLRLVKDDRDLVATATRLILKRARTGHHHVSCALLTSNGDCVLGLHVSAQLGVSSICAEAAAIAEAVKAGRLSIDRVVSIRRTFSRRPGTEVVPPCGRSRELILQYGSGAQVILSLAEGLTLVPIIELLPVPFARRGCRTQRRKHHL